MTWDTEKYLLSVLTGVCILKWVNFTANIRTFHRDKRNCPLYIYADWVSIEHSSTVFHKEYNDLMNLYKIKSVDITRYNFFHQNQ